MFRQNLRIEAGSFHKIINNVLTKVSVNGLAPGSKMIGGDAKRFNVALTNTDGGYVQPSCIGSLIQNRYNLEVSAKMTGCQCCDEAPTASIEANIYNRTIERNIWAPPSNWQPQIMQTYNCNFNSQFAFSGGMTSNLTPPGVNLNVAMDASPFGGDSEPNFGQQGKPAFGANQNANMNINMGNGFGQMPGMQMQVEINTNTNANGNFGQ